MNQLLLGSNPLTVAGYTYKGNASQREEYEQWVENVKVFHCNALVGAEIAMGSKAEPILIETPARVYVQFKVGFVQPVIDYQEQLPDIAQLYQNEIIHRLKTMSMIFGTYPTNIYFFAGSDPSSGRNGVLRWWGRVQYRRWRFGIYRPKLWKPNREFYGGYMEWYL